MHSSELTYQQLRNAFTYPSDWPHPHISKIHPLASTYTLQSMDEINLENVLHLPNSQLSTWNHKSLGFSIVLLVSIIHLGNNYLIYSQSGIHNTISNFVVDLMMQYEYSMDSHLLSLLIQYTHQ